LIKALEDAEPKGETSIAAVLQELAASLKRRGVIILISDLLDEHEEVVKGLKQLRSRGSEVIVFHLLDREELQFPFKEPYLFQDMEEDLRLLADPEAIKTAYLKAIGSLIDGYRHACSSRRIDYLMFDTSTELEKALARYLTWRQKLRVG